MFGNYLLLASSIVGYNPTDLALTVFLNAKNNSSVTVQTGVSQWTSLNAINPYVQTNTAAQPVYNLTGMENAPAIQFDGVNDVLTLGNYTQGIFTRFFVVKMDVPNGFLFATVYDYIWAGSGSTFEIARNGVFSSKNIASGWLNNNKTKVVMWRFDGTQAGHQVWVNGVQKVATDGSIGNPGSVLPPNSNANLGSRGSNGFSKGLISAFVDRPFAMTDLQAKNELNFLISNFIPLAKLNTNGDPILDVNGDFTY